MFESDIYGGKWWGKDDSKFPTFTTFASETLPVKIIQSLPKKGTVKRIDQ